MNSVCIDVAGSCSLTSNLELAVNLVCAQLSLLPSAELEKTSNVSDIGYG